MQKQAFRDALDTFAGVNDALFFLFFAAFTVGLFGYGFALVLKSGIDQAIGLLFLLWGVLSLPGLTAAIVGNEALSAGFDWVGRYFQPAARFSLGLWLWNVAGRFRTR